MDLDERERRFRALYESTLLRIAAYAARRTPSPEDAADLVAEVYAVAWRRLDDLPSGEGALLWLYGVARRTLANQRRSNHRRSALVTRLAVEMNSSFRPDADSDARLVALEALRKLNDDERELLMLVAWDGLSISQLAQLFGCSTTAIGIRLHRARRSLRTYLGDRRVFLKQSRPVGHELNEAPKTPLNEWSASEEGVR
jgi:RNA polymerase sigma factor (sigma-70 family)